MSASLKARAILVIPASILLLILACLGIGYFIASETGLPLSLGFPLALRVVGYIVLFAGLVVMRSVFRIRKPVDVLVSTYVTFSKVRRHIPLEEPAERTETLTIRGPYKYARHPLYLGVIMLWIGVWLISAYSFLIITTLLFYAWFFFVITPLEERELLAMFGDQYARYMRQVPRLIPFTRLRK